MAIIGAVLMVAVGAIPARDAISAIDFATIVLLFAMMLIVGNLRLAGFFELAEEFITHHLKPAHLLPAIIFSSGVLSAFLVNDIVCLVMTPFVFGLVRRMGIAPLPYLLALATASNIGSVATITGNPQNMLIGSYSGIAYLDFMIHLGPVALAGLFVDWAVLHWLYFRGQSAARPAAIPTRSVARTQDAPLRKSLIVLVAVLGGFLAGFPPAMVAALGAALLLVTRTVEPRKTYAEIDWGLLVFFLGLFLIVAGAERAGLSAPLLRVAARWNLEHPAVLTVATAALSNIVSNVPAVMVLKSLAPKFADPHAAWLLLAMASTLAGNLTITGSVANLIVVEQARSEIHIGFWDYFRAGAPITIITLSLGVAWLALVR